MDNESDRPEFTEETAEAVHSATDRAAKFAHEAIDRLAQRTGRIEEQIRGMSDKTTDQSRELTSVVVSYVEQHPFTALGAAAAAGFVLGAILRR